MRLLILFAVLSLIAESTTSISLIEVKLMEKLEPFWLGLM